jgi:TPR repeat protein
MSDVHGNSSVQRPRGLSTHPIEGRATRLGLGAVAIGDVLPQRPWCKSRSEKGGHMVQKSAAQGDHPAEHQLGEMYRLGQGVKRSHPEAARWYQKAADGGYALSQFALGIMLLVDSGEGVPKNTTEGARLLILSAEQGFPEAQFALANCYKMGRGLESSLDKSLYWNKKSAVQGYAKAMANYGSDLLSVAVAKYKDNTGVV